MQAALQNDNTPPFFVRKADGQAEEKWWITLIGEEVKKWKQRVRDLEELIPLDDPPCPLQIAFPSISERTVTAIADLVTPQASGIEVASSVSPIIAQVPPS